MKLEDVGLDDMVRLPDKPEWLEFDNNGVLRLVETKVSVFLQLKDLKRSDWIVVRKSKAKDEFRAIVNKLNDFVKKEYSGNYKSVKKKLIVNEIKGILKELIDFDKKLPDKNCIDDYPHSKTKVKDEVNKK